ncbi:MAG: MnhB domain-containing protein, partial [Candidatus Cloacimonadaceae bacterium]|nr:MnhB domain-containing protein [Candidatus Cloacimonadaceae bacterium]
GITPAAPLPDTSNASSEAAQTDVSAQTGLTPILLVWRGLDTMGELIILFLATTAIAFLSRKNQTHTKGFMPPYLNATRVAVSGVAVLQPLLFVFAIYIFSFGHLSPGGAFQGGVILGSGFVLWILVHPNDSFQIQRLNLLEAVCGIAYLVLASLGLILMGTFLDPGYSPFGQMGDFFSTATLPLMYIFIGIKVGVEMIKIVTKFRA